MSIGNRIQECVNKLALNDCENAFIQLAIAIDATAKREYPGQRTTDRCKRFLRSNLPFVMWSLTNGAPSETQELTFEFSPSGTPSGPTNFEDLIYRIMRCALLHEAELPEKVEFVTENYIGMLGGKMQFPMALIGSLLFAVIASPTNNRERVSESTSFKFGQTEARVNDMMGSLVRTKDAIRKGFLFDLEAMLSES